MESAETVMESHLNASERDKMTSGAAFDAFAPELLLARARAKEVTESFNVAPHDERISILRMLLDAGEGCVVNPPFHCDYGFNIHLGASVYVDHDCIILDGAPVSVGDGSTLCGSVSLLTACHPIDYRSRQRLEEFSRPVGIGRDCWIGPHSTLCPGSSIGDGCVVCENSVVTKNFSGNCLLVGSPARVEQTFASTEEREECIRKQPNSRVIAL